MTPGVLYLCYQSVTEPLTQTQVVAYLEGLSRSGYRIVLLTFEPTPLSPDEAEAWRVRLSKLGVNWTWCRYHKRPTVPATTFDILVGFIKGFTLIHRYGLDLVHARGHVPCVMGALLKILTGVKLLFDVRGFMAEEYVDAGVWRSDGRLFRWTKRTERWLVEKADAIVVLTIQGHSILKNWYSKELADKLIQIVPCCVDLRDIAVKQTELSDSTVQSPRRMLLLYVGKLGGWYLTEEMVAFFSKMMTIIHDSQLEVWTQSDASHLKNAVDRVGIRQQVFIGRMRPEELRDRMRHACVGLSLIKPCRSKLASSPTKVAEYLASGLPVISTAGIGDTDLILRNGATEGEDISSAVGVLLDVFNEEAYSRAATEIMRLLSDPDTPRRCRAVAKEHFDLEQVGWVRYRHLYRSLIGEVDPIASSPDVADPAVADRGSASSQAGTQLP